MHAFNVSVNCLTCSDSPEILKCKKKKDINMRLRLPNDLPMTPHAPPSPGLACIPKNHLSELEI